MSAGASYDPTGSGIPLTDWLGATPSLEYAHMENQWGTPGLERDYALGGLALTHGRWALDLDVGLRRSTNSKQASNFPFTNAQAFQGNNAWDVQENASLVYEVIDNLKLAIGIDRIRIAGRPSTSLAQSIDYRILF